MTNLVDIVGKTFLITGGASGLGAMYAEAFLKEGAKKVAIVDISEESGRATTAKLNTRYPDKAVFVKCDVGIETQVALTFEKVVKELGRLDVLVNNAGVMNDAPHVVWKACEINWNGLVSFTMRAQKHMRKDEGGFGGTIVNVSSVAGLTPFKPLPAYCGSKAAVIHFGRSLAHPTFYEATGVRILTICPGQTDTPLLQGLKGKSYSERMGQELHDIFEALLKIFPAQKPESAVAAMLKMFKEGENGSVWLTASDKPAKNITYIFDNFEKEYTVASN